MFSVIVPVYKNEGSIHQLVVALTELDRALDHQLEAILVVDGSPDSSEFLLRAALQESTVRAELVCLSRNFGSFAAIRAGLTIATGQYFAVMAADLQEPPELILDFFKTLSREPFDLVLGKRTSRDDPGTTKHSAQLFWMLYRRFVHRDIPPGGIDIFGCNRTVRDALLQMHESHSSLVVQLVWLGFRRTAIPYHRQARAGGGKSAWSFQKKVHYMLDSIFAFTSLPIHFITAVGVLGALTSFLISTVVLTSWMAGLIQVSGYTPLMLIQCLSMSLNLMALGVIGSYIWRTYENTKNRPLSLLMTRESFHKDQLL
jgi:glycosyltransferase involved in cell wall biosynthesis